MRPDLRKLYEAHDRFADSLCPHCGSRLRSGHTDVECEPCGRTWPLVLTRPIQDGDRRGHPRVRDWPDKLRDDKRIT